MDYMVHGILQARILEWVAVSSPAKKMSTLSLVRIHLTESSTPGLISPRVLVEGQLPPPAVSKMGFSAPGQYCVGSLPRARIIHCTGLSIPVLEPTSGPKVSLCPLTSPFLRGLRKISLLTGAEKAPEGQAHDFGAQILDLC